MPEQNLSQMVTAASLNESAVKFGKELLTVMLISLEKSIKHMSIRKGIRYKEVLPSFHYNSELYAYDESAPNKKAKEIKSRTIEVFLGMQWDQFSPNSLLKSIFGSDVTHGEGLKAAEVNKLIIARMMKNTSNKLNAHLWDAKRVEGSKTTKELFNGFDTITSEEITAKTISAANNNLHSFTAAISADNAVDMLKEFYRSTSDELKEQITYMYVSHDIYNKYCDDMKTSGSGLVYNKAFEQNVLEGSEGMCIIVPLANKKSSPFITLSIEDNMKIGVNQQIPGEEKIVIEKHSPFVFDFVVTVFFGTQFERIDSDVLHIGKLYVAP